MVISYHDYGAIGDGVADDFDAIIRTHAAANQQNLPVKADPNATYYIGGGDKTALVQTSTDWGTAKFIIDDTKTENRQSRVFQVISNHEPEVITNIKSLKKNQDNIGTSLQHDSVVVAIDNTTMRFIREGLNQDTGTQQTDVFIVSKDGQVDSKTPILWDYTNITSLTAYPIDAEPLTLKGGHFTTIANQETPEYKYFSRNIEIKRSNVVVDGLVYTITGEPEANSAPYDGFISIRECAGVTVINCKLTAHKTFTTIGRAGLPVDMGSYGLSAHCAVNLLYKNCVQLNDINNVAYWGLFGSNFTKNVTFDTVSFSRFDAHMGTTNPVIINSEIGHMGIKLIGRGSCLIENTKVTGRQFVDLRPDYGSTWEGDIAIRSCEFTPTKMEAEGAVVISAEYSGLHDFGYPCFMPSQIVIDGLIINDDQPVENYNGLRILSAIHPNYQDENFKEKYPYTLPKMIEVKNLTAKSGMDWALSDNLLIANKITKG